MDDWCFNSSALITLQSNIAVHTASQLSSGERIKRGAGALDALIVMTVGWDDARQDYDFMSRRIIPLDYPLETSQVRRLEQPIELR
jgi:hypothetical protein